MIQQITQAIESLTKGASPKEAHKQVKEVYNCLQRLAFFPHAEVLTKVEELTQLDAGLHLLKSKKYEKKIHLQLQSIRDKKVLWTAQPLLAPHCRQFYFAGEDKDSDTPLQVPLSTLERLMTNSTRLQADWENQVIHLHQVSRRHFVTIVEHLCNEHQEVPEEILELYQAAKFLGIQKLQTIYLAQLGQALSRATWQSLFETICNICVGNISDQEFAIEALMAFLKEECRHVLNKDFLIQHDIDVAVKDFCERKKKTSIEFWQLAGIHFPEFVHYLVRKSGHLPKESKHPTIPEQVGRVLALYKQGAPIVFDAALYTGRTLDAYLHALSQSQKGCEIIQTTSTAFLQRNPDLWLAQYVNAFPCNQSSDYYEDLLNKVFDFMSKHEGASTAKLQRCCAALSFLCFLFLGKSEKALATIHQFDYRDLPAGTTVSYFIFLMDQGIYGEQEFSSKPSWLKHLETLYRLEPLAIENPITNQNQSYTTPHFHLEDKEKSIQSLRKHCGDNQKEILPKTHLARLLWKEKKYQEFLTYCSEVLAVEKNGALLFRRCLFYQQTKQLDLAEKDASDLVQLSFRFTHLNLLVSIIAKQRGQKAALDYLSTLPEKKATQLCQALWMQDVLSLETVKDENNPDYWQVHGILHKRYESFKTGLGIKSHHLGCLNGIIDWGNRVL